MRYPERQAGGYTRVDGSIAFYGRVQALIAEHPEPVTIMDFGAGRGGNLADPVPFRRALRTLQGAGRTVVGVDVDPVVLEHPALDEAHVIDHTGRIPVDAASVDIIVSDFTWEHIDDAQTIAAELDRVLRPGGWICARTPNRWGYIALGARLVPNRLHVAALRRLQPSKAAHDTFPTRYRLNTRRAFAAAFPEDRFLVCAYCADAEPTLYAGSSTSIATAVSVLHHLPERFKSMWYVFIQKR